ncbi:nuclear transport factor 2 family protein [Streptomyces sp. NPDC058459]|uniref:nuclear transport factor 2 family protein n=1 Tax=Streptomyces sp. NPDC058459 TaxID=3346508 RepID=UPI003656F539
MTVVEKFLDGYRAAWANRDPAAIEMLFTEDGQYREKPYAPAFQGRSGIRDYWSKVTSTQSDISVRYGTPIVVGNRAAVEWWVNLTNSGSAVTLAGSFLLRFADDGLCEELVEYWHFDEGTLAPPTGWGE